MREENLNYNNFKIIVNAKGLLWQYTETNDYYHIFAIDNNIQYTTAILKSTSLLVPIGKDLSQEQTNQTDFETNYKIDANDTLDKRTSDGLHKVAKTTFTDTLSLYLKGGKVNIPASSTGNIDFQFTFDVRLVGAVGFWNNADIGDYIEFSIGYYTNPSDPNTWIEVTKYGETLYVSGTSHLEITGDDSAEITSGVVVKAQYTNVSASNTKDFICWLRNYR